MDGVWTRQVSHWVLCSPSNVLIAEDFITVPQVLKWVFIQLAGLKTGTVASGIDNIAFVYGMGPVG
jgi:hypothetical protein